MITFGELRDTSTKSLSLGFCYKEIALLLTHLGHSLLNKDKKLRC